MVRSTFLTVCCTCAPLLTALRVAHWFHGTWLPTWFMNATILKAPRSRTPQHPRSNMYTVIDFLSHLVNGTFAAGTQVLKM